MSTILFTHNDLDALGCVISVRERLEPEKIFYTNYANIGIITANILQYANEHDIKNIIIADVSFSDHKQHLRNLYNYFSSKGKIIYIDHHLYADGFFDEFPKMFIKHTYDCCASQLCFNNFNHHSNIDPAKLKRLKSLIHLIDVYDIWQVDNKLFSTAQDLNEYFFFLKYKDKDKGEDAILDIAKIFKNNSYKLPKNFKSVTRQIRQNAEKVYHEYVKHNMVKRSDAGAKITLIFGPDFFNYMMIKEMQQGQDFVIGVVPGGIFKIRINTKSNYTSNFKKNVRAKLMSQSDIGHENAFTYKITEAPTLENIIKECQRITEAINSTPNQ